jgi:hypothetical protein
MLTIRKRGNKNFNHEDSNPVFQDYSANDIKIEFNGNNVRLRSLVGGVVLRREGYLFTDVIVIDDTALGASETFPNVSSLVKRLINLGYPFNGGSEEIVLTEVDWGNITGNIINQSDLIELVGGSQDFTATDGQTVFTITANPTELKMVFKGRTLALDTVDYTYSAGTLTFNDGLFLNTKVKVIY